MNGEERRNLILGILQQASEPINATKLAEKFSVTRQIIVADIALLRAAGRDIRAERRGYVMNNALSGMRKSVVVKHGKTMVQEEFYAVVDNGGKVLDVTVDHPIYGTIAVKLNIVTRHDADLFVEKMSDANPLSLLTEGLHVHNITIPDEESFTRIVKKLKAMHILIEAN